MAIAPAQQAICGTGQGRITKLLSLLRLLNAWASRLGLPLQRLVSSNHQVILLATPPTFMTRVPRT